MSDTPLTDEQINGKPCTQFGLLAGMSLRNALVPSEFARQLERELAATQILLHESLIREERFYRELAAANEACRKASLDALHMRDDFLKELATANAAKDTEKYCFASCAFFAAKDAEIARLRESLHDWTGKQEASK
jgi:hypothetical protein